MSVLVILLIAGVIVYCLLNQSVHSPKNRNRRTRDITPSKQTGSERSARLDRAHTRQSSTPARLSPRSNRTPKEEAPANRSTQTKDPKTQYAPESQRAHCAGRRAALLGVGDLRGLVGCLRVTPVSGTRTGYHQPWRRYVYRNVSRHDDFSPSQPGQALARITGCSASSSQSAQPTVKRSPYRVK